MTKKYGVKSNNTNAFKEYDSVSFHCQFIEDDSEEPLSLEDISVVSDMNDSDGNLICRLDVVVLDVPNGIFMLKPIVGRLPVGRHDIDILLKNSVGSITTSETFHIDVEKSETNPNR